jgi:bleomycin hydrolase
MKNILFTFLIGILILTVPVKFVNAQDNDTTESKGYEFTVVNDLSASSVKNQYRSGTCWSFSSNSFFEAELLRMGKGEFDLSEMFVVWHTYADKSVSYVRWHGDNNFGGGGAFHDVLYVMENYGMVPEEVYDGKVIGEKNHIHGEMDAVLKGYMDAVLKNKNKKLTPVWHDGLEGILDAYLGELPTSFIYEGTEYTPRSFADNLGLNVEDYVELGSYTHHPFYERFILEVPDNWLYDKIYNVPMDDMISVIDNALENGYTVGWGADVSEKGFSWKNGVAIVPEEDVSDLSGTEKEKWEKLTEKEKKAALYKFDGPHKEKTITQEMRQEEFDNYQTTDDHGMHITGTATDQDGNKYYIVKNSWGTDGHIYDGYFYASVPFVQLKTIDLIVHKDAVPKGLQDKLGF